MEERRSFDLAVIATAGALVASLGLAAAWDRPATAAAAAPATGKAAAVLPPPQPPVLAISPAPDARGVDPIDAVAVQAKVGSLAGVSMVNEAGAPIPGGMTPDNTAWKPHVPLGYGRTYTLTVTGRGTDASTATHVTRFSTVIPEEQTDVSLTTTSGADITEGGTYGVGMVVVAQFDEPVPDRAAAERRLQVSTSPPVEGAWNWVSDRKAHWRPREYFPSGTKVSVAANIYGARLGEGLYGSQDRRVNFTIGPSHVSIADDNTKHISVYENGKLVRTMPTSMGRGGSEFVGGNEIKFWTQPGVYTVMDKAEMVVMDSSTYGLPVSSSSGYRINVPFATRISPDGIYLHQLEDTVWAQGNTNVSAGCLNLSAEHAEWFYNFSRPGDVVEVRNTGGEPLQQWQNGDWSVPWEQWRQGSALS